MNLGALASLLLAEGLYVRAIGILRGRGVTVGRGQQACFHGAMLLWAIGLLSPLDAAAERGFTPHMAQHLLIADLAAPLLLAGIRNPVLVFLLPRPVLVGLARRGRARRAFRTLRRPLVALAVYGLVLYAWHFAFLFEAAVQSPLVHAVQHGSFVGIGILVWWAALEPKRRRLRGELWKIGHILSARMIGMFLAMAFVLIREPIYTGVYGPGGRPLGLEPVADQQVAGALMLSVDICIMVFALAFFFFRAAGDEDRREAKAAALPVRRAA